MLRRSLRGPGGAEVPCQFAAVGSLGFVPEWKAGLMASMLFGPWSGNGYKAVFLPRL